MTEADGYIDIFQAAQILGTNDRVARYHLHNAGVPRFKRLGSQRRWFKREDVERFAAERGGFRPLDNGRSDGYTTEER